VAVPGAESLSNASRHAPGAAVTVSVAHDARAVLLRVANGLPGPPGNGHGPGPGDGLTGMRERAALLGGSLSAGPSPGGGFVVSAVLPLGAAANCGSGAGADHLLCELSVGTVHRRQRAGHRLRLLLGIRGTQQQLVGAGRAEKRWKRAGTIPQWRDCGLIRAPPPRHAGRR
jgi:hypothetical protein